MSDNTLLIMSTAGIATFAGYVHETLQVKYDPTTKKSNASLKAPKMKPVIGGFLVGLFMFGINAVSDQVTHALCILIIIGSLIMAFPSVMTALNVGGFTKS